jgi:hypothetical protein
MSPIIESIKDLYRENLNEIDVSKVAKSYNCKVRIEDNEWNRILILRFNSCILDEVRGIDFPSRGLRSIRYSSGPVDKSESLGIDDENFTNYKPVIIYKTTKGGGLRKNETEIKVDISYLNNEHVFNVMNYLANLARLARFKLSKDDKELIRKI